jgi:hypothetical protein
MDDDGEWLYDALVGSTLEISHNGSYMKELARDVCACGVVFHCTATNKFADLTWGQKEVQLKLQPTTGGRSWEV